MHGSATGHGSIRDISLGRALAVLTATLLLLAGCSSTAGSGEFLTSLASVHSKLLAAGFDDAGVHAGRREYLEHPEESVDIVTVVLLHDSMDGDVARKTAATVVWNELPMKFDILAIEYQGETREIEYEWLANELGPRPAGLDDRSVGDHLSGVGNVLMVAGGIAFVVLLIVAVPVFVLVRRNVRKKAQVPAPVHHRLQDDDFGADQGPGLDRERFTEPS